MPPNGGILICWLLVMRRFLPYLANEAPRAMLLKLLHSTSLFATPLRRLVHLCLSVVPAVRARVDAKCGPASFPCLSSFRSILLCELSKGMP